jgi:rsbT co-antagonist protein RsbR
MPTATSGTLARVVRTHQDDILSGWIREQGDGGRNDAIQRAENRRVSTRVLGAMTDCLEDGPGRDVSASGWSVVRDLLGDFSAARANGGFSSTDTATFVFCLKQPVFQKLRIEVPDAQVLGEELWGATEVIDQMGLYTAETYHRTRNDVIRRHQNELLELSTPVVELAKGILALPLIGTLDSARTQVVMETLLEKIVEAEAAIAIIDITGVPTVDTLVAQHLMKTVAAARLMGAECMVSGIRPQIAQTIVHLGIDLATITTKATLGEAFKLALHKMGNVRITRIAGGGVSQPI